MESPVSTRRNSPVPRAENWIRSLQHAFRRWDDLRQYLQLPELESTSSGRAAEAARDFPLLVPQEFAAKMTPGDPHDPLLLQVLPVAAEMAPVPLSDASTLQPAYGDDPVGDLEVRVGPGLLHKYASRALLITAGTCAVHCRYCFRRYFPYEEAAPQPAVWDAAVRYLADHPEVDEVILSGGDPLMLADGHLDRLVDRLESVPHLQRLRIHTRLPIVIPSRITPPLLDILSATRLTPWLVIHANHPREFDGDTWEALGQLTERGVPVLNQAVLLRGVNDRAEVLIELCRNLVNHRIWPYYLNQLDRVRGAAHFEVDVAAGRELIAQLRQALPGYAVPSYVTDRPGGTSKEPL